MNKLTPLVVPPKLRELLKDDPEHIVQLQDLLNSFAIPRVSVQPFESALWLLKDVLSEFLSEASDGLKRARESGDTDAVVKAEEKWRRMLLAFSNSSSARAELIDGLWDFFELNKEAFEPKSGFWSRLGL